MDAHMTTSTLDRVPTNTFVDLYAVHNHAVRGLMTLWVVVIVLMGTNSRKPPSLRLACVLLAVTRMSYLVLKLPDYAGVKPPAVVAALLNTIPMACQLFGVHYSTDLAARCRIQHRDVARAGLSWRAARVAVKGMGVPCLLFLWIFMVPANSYLLPALARIGTWWQAGVLAFSGIRLLLHLCAYEVEALAEVYHPVPLQRASATLRMQTMLWTQALCFWAQAACCLLSFHKPVFFRRHFFITQGSFLLAEYVGLVMLHLQPDELASWGLAGVVSSWHTRWWRRREARRLIDVDMHMPYASWSRGEALARRRRRREEVASRARQESDEEARRRDVMARLHRSDGTSGCNTAIQPVLQGSTAAGAA